MNRSRDLCGGVRGGTVLHNVSVNFDSSCFVMLISHSGGSTETQELFLRKQIRTEVKPAHSFANSFCDLTVYLITSMLRMFWVQYKLSSITELVAQCQFPQKNRKVI